MKSVVAIVCGVSVSLCAASAWACGGEKAPKDERPDDPAVFCDGEKAPKDDRPDDPAVLCGGEKTPQDDSPDDPA